MAIFAELEFGKILAVVAGRYIDDKSEIRREW